MPQVSLSQVWGRMTREVVVIEPQHVEGWKLRPKRNAARGRDCDERLLLGEGFLQEKTQDLAIPLPQLRLRPHPFRVLELRFPKNTEQKAKGHSDHPLQALLRLAKGLNSATRLDESKG